MLNIFKNVVFLTLICHLITASNANERAITTADLIALRDISKISVSPDGNHVAYRVVQADAERNRYHISWHVVAAEPSAEPITVIDGLEAALATNSGGIANGELHRGEVVWSPDGQWIVYTLKKNNEIQLWRSHRERYGQEQMTHNAADVQSPRFSSDGTTIFFAVGRDRSAIRELNRAQARQGYLAQEPPIYVVQRGPIGPPCADGRERSARTTDDTRACDLRIWALDLETGAERFATPAETEAYFAAPDTSLVARVGRGRLSGNDRIMEMLSPDGQNAAWFENVDPEIFHGYQPPMRVAVSEDDQTLRCQFEECRSARPRNLWWRAGGDEVIILVRNGYHNTLSSLYGWSPSEDSVRTILSTDDMFYDCAMSADRLICGHESWTSPRRIVSVDLSDGEITTIVDPNPEFQNFRFTRIEKILGTDAYGNEAHAHLVYPQGYEDGRRYPLVIVQYRSRGFLRGGVGDEHPIHVLAQNGFAVLSFDEPEGNYLALEGDRLALQIAYQRYAIVHAGPVTAIERMVDELDRRGIIDPERVGITGLSSGASNTDLAVLRRNYGAASVAYSNMSPPNFDWDPLSFVGRALDGTFGGSPFSSEGFASRAYHSVGSNAARIDTPYLIQVADREYYRTHQNYHALRGAEKPVELHIFPDEYHVKWQPAHRLTVYNRNLDWFNFWLLDVEDDDPDKVEQYGRWRQLRRQQRENLLVRQSGR